MRFWWLSFEKGDNYLDKHRLRKHSNWSQKPNGYAGAFILAKEREETRTQFKAFFLEVMPKPKPWFSILVKDEDWFNN